MIKLTEFKPLSPHSVSRLLMATVAVPAGEPQDIESQLEEIDFNEYLTGGENGVFLISVTGDSMEAKIFHGDLLVVNRNLQPQPGETVVASVNGAYTVKIFAPCRNGLRLVAANEKYKTKTVTPGDHCEIFGVVTHVVRRLKKI